MRDELLARWPRSSPRCPCACRCGSATASATTTHLRPTDPGQPDRVVADRRARRPRPRSTTAVAGAPRAASRAGRRPRPPSAPRSSSRAAAWLRERRAELAALAVRECAKPWAEADADVCEAIDFLEFYARGAVALDRGTAAASRSPGERNELRYAPRGVVAVISPWNFPLAIPHGHGRRRAGHRQRGRPQAGRAVARAARSWSSARCARRGVPADALALLPGEGDGRRRAGRATRACTRSPSPARARSGLEIVRAAAEVRAGQRHLKRVVAEMGGKNCVIVDSDADLDEAVPAHRAVSAFVYAGQKCSAAARVLVHEAIARRAARARSRARSRCSTSARPTPSASTCRR